MDFFDKHKALIITSLLFAVLFLALYNLNMANKKKAAGEMLVDLEQFQKEKAPEEEQEEQEEQPQQQRRNVQTNKAYNEDKEARDADMKNKLDEIFQKNSASQEAEESEDTQGDGNYQVNKKTADRKKDASNGDDSSEESSQKSAVYDYSSISFSLKGRRAVKIPNPVYTCDVAGKIVINISVDANGFVIDTSLNKGSSTSGNECLVERAMEYAAGARFSKLAGKNEQPGTITYYFRS
jgi:membrane-associated HD superfamily phosphohydrolase